MDYTGNLGLPALYLGPISGGDGDGASAGGEGAVGGVAESGVADSDNQDAISTDDNAESMPEKPGKPISEADFRKFQKGADQRHEAAVKQGREAQNATMAAMQYITQLEGKVTELSMAGAPPEVIDAAKQRQVMQMERLQLDQERQGMLPAVRQAALLSISAEYGCPMEELTDSGTRAEAEATAKAYKRFFRKNTLEQRAAKGTDKQEGSSPTTGADISKIKDATKLFEMAFKGK